MDQTADRMADTVAEGLRRHDRRRSRNALIGLAIILVVVGLFVWVLNGDDGAAEQEASRKRTANPAFPLKD